MATVTIETPNQRVTLDDAAVQRLHERLSARVPDDEEFDDNPSGFLLAPGVEAIANDLIGRYEELRHLEKAEFVYVWKRKGGKVKGKLRFGSCQHPTGFLAFFGRADFVVAISADHCRDAALSGAQLEALVYHELCHAGWEIDDEGEMAWATVGHDWEGFRGEIERFGLWEPDLERLGETFKQTVLFA